MEAADRRVRRDDLWLAFLAIPPGVWWVVFIDLGLGSAVSRWALRSSFADYHDDAILITALGPLLVYPWVVGVLARNRVTTGRRRLVGSLSIGVGTVLYFLVRSPSELDPLLGWLGILAVIALCVSLWARLALWAPQEIFRARKEAARPRNGP